MSVSLIPVVRLAVFEGKWFYDKNKIDQSALKAYVRHYFWPSMLFQ